MSKKTFSLFMSCMIIFALVIFPVNAVKECIPGEVGRINVWLKRSDYIYSADDFSEINIERIEQNSTSLIIYISEKTEKATDSAMQQIKIILANKYTSIIQDYKLTYFYEWPGYMLGDVNEDGFINLTDVSLLLKYFAGWNVDVEDNDLSHNDFNRDGEVNIDDVLLMLKYIAGWQNINEWWH